MEFEFNKPEVVAEAPIVEEVKEETVEVAPVVEDVKPVEEVKVVEEQPKKKALKTDLVTVRSDRNISWDGVGSLVAGLNKVTKEDADKWVAAKYYVKLVEETNK